MSGPTRNIKGVVFDVDGTLLDTREYIQQAYERTLAAHRHDVPARETLIETIRTGAPLEDCYAVFAPNGDIVALRDTHREFQKQSYEAIVAYEGLIDFLRTLKESGIRLGACSSRGGTVRPSLQHMQALSYFDCVVDATEVVHHKPHPEGLLKVLSAMGVLPGEAAMVGDTKADIGAGKRAGVAMSIGITHGFGTRESLLEAGADHVADGLEEVLAFLA